MTPFARHITFGVVFLLFSLVLIYHSYEPPYVTLTSQGRQSKNNIDGDSDVSLQQVLQFIYNPNKFAVTTPSFLHDGKTYKLPPKPTFHQPLGKYVLILDVDTRPFDGDHQIFHEGSFEWAKLDPYSSGMINHYMYAQLHGYSYKFLQLPPPKDRHPTWVKVQGLLQTLPAYKYVIFLDADALFNHLHIPIEWLLNYWHIGPSTSLAMALDPPGPQNNDTTGRRYLNTGFIIAQNMPKTHEILSALNDCPSEAVYKGCAKFRNGGFHEQGALGTYVRYDYEEWIMELPCEEANGEWDLEVCRGAFVQHMWWRTMNVGKRVGDVALQGLMARVREGFLEEKG